MPIMVLTCYSNIDNKRATTAIVTVYGYAGNSLIVEKVNLTAGTNSIRLEKAANLPNGVYMVSVLVENEKLTERVVIQR